MKRERIEARKRFAAEIAARDQRRAAKAEQRRDALTKACAGDTVQAAAVERMIDQRTEVCPDCGRWCRYLHQETGFCQACTYSLKGRPAGSSLVVASPRKSPVGRRPSVLPSVSASNRHRKD